jgi:hypothetical protein
VARDKENESYKLVMTVAPSWFSFGLPSNCFGRKRALKNYSERNKESRIFLEQNLTYRNGRTKIVNRFYFILFLSFQKTVEFPIIRVFSPDIPNII